MQSCLIFYLPVHLTSDSGRVCTAHMDTEDILLYFYYETNWHHGTKFLLRIWQFISYYSIHSQHFIEPEGSLPCSQEPAACPYPGPYQLEFRIYFVCRCWLLGKSPETSSYNTDVCVRVCVCVCVCETHLSLPSSWNLFHALLIQRTSTGAKWSSVPIFCFYQIRINCL